jgi:HPt (histidine-containing phosphotransfer) domain-containing protein
MSQAESPQIKALKERYRASFPEKVELLRQQREVITHDQINSQQRLQVNELLHKLAGSSGMYGYLEINASCREIMVEIDVLDVATLVVMITELMMLLERHS